MSRNTRKTTNSRKRIIQQSGSSSEEENDTQTTQMSDMTFNPVAHSSMAVPSSSSQAVAVESGNHDTMVTNLVKFLLNYSATKVPIKRTDITKQVNIGPKSFPKVLKDAKMQLEIVYGLTVEEITTKSGKVYILYSCIKTNFKIELFTVDQMREIGLLFTILSLIFMKNGEVTETNLFRFLAELDIHAHTTHKKFGDVGKAIRETFPRQLYLRRKKIDTEGSNEPTFTYAWGRRAEAEFDLKSILKTVAELMGKSPASFVNQYSHAHGDQQPINATQASIAIDDD